ncbi:hypothetical protein JX266_004075 [Neoarthrinium moseri]|nr:hypothetical protein JX266_004075 [Neoarthrinium moseri]
MGDIGHSTITVAIAGGGIAGLALATGLAKQTHISVRVYESIPSYQDVGAGLALHRNAIAAMSLVGPELRDAYFEKALSMAADADIEMATEVILAQGKNKGQKVAELGRAKGRMSVARSDLLEGFFACLPKETVVFGKRLTSIREMDGGQRISIGFQDGTSAEADVLIGADGVHSFTRSYLLGPDHPAAAPKNHDAWTIYRTMVSMDEARKHIDSRWCSTVPILLGLRGHVNVIPLNKGTRLSAGIAVRGASNPDLVSRDASEPPKLNPDKYTDYSDEAQQIIRLVVRDPSASWKPADHDHAPFYARGRIAVVGDAAHASLPFAGNGAAQALEDAAALTAVFARVRFPAGQADMALRAYDVVRRARSQRVVDLARRLGRIYAYAEKTGKPEHDGGGEEEGEEEEEEGRWLHESPEVLGRSIAEMGRFTNEFDVAGQNREAVELFDMLVWLDEEERRERDSVGLTRFGGASRTESVDGLRRVNGAISFGLVNEVQGHQS